MGVLGRHRGVAGQHEQVPERLAHLGYEGIHVVSGGGVLHVAMQSIQQPLDPMFEVNQRFELLLFFEQMGLLDAQFLKLHAHGSDMV